jgi:hypothetical protein
MTRTIITISLILFAQIGLSDTEALDQTQRNVDYTKLDHSVKLAHLRAGNHDDSGMNDYYFLIKFFGLVSNEEERRKPVEERRIKNFDGGTFAELSIKSLSFWESQKDSTVTDFKVSGDFIREIISKTMLEYGVVETETAVLAEIEMYEKNKQYVFFGEDTLVAKTSYFPIPSTKFDAPPKTNQDLHIKDNKGTNVVIKIDYGPEKIAKK